ncbi:MAG: adaptor protein MecA [Ruminococcaceae bacterium]|nr:adaptor protein MecA [Oscillospiraceae bacterium]
MKIEKLSTDKIKVTVTPEELDTWDINPREISPDLPQLKDFIASLIKQSYNASDDELLNSNILVEARPQGENFVFVITRVGGDYEKIQKQISGCVKKQKFLNGNYTPRIVSEDAMSYFLFDSLDDFCQMLGSVGCKALQDTVLYKAQDGFFLGIKRLGSDFKKICSLVSEYAKSAGHDAAVNAYICEHTTKFAEYKDYEALRRCF